MPTRSPSSEKTACFVHARLARTFNRTEQSSVLTSASLVSLPVSRHAPSGENSTMLSHFLSSAIYRSARAGTRDRRYGCSDLCPRRRIHSRCCYRRHQRLLQPSSRSPGWDRRSLPRCLAVPSRLAVRMRGPVRDHTAVVSSFFHDDRSARVPDPSTPPKTCGSVSTARHNPVAIR